MSFEEVAQSTDHDNNGDAPQDPSRRRFLRDTLSAIGGIAAAGVAGGKAAMAREAIRAVEKKMGEGAEERSQDNARGESASAEAVGKSESGMVEKSAGEAQEEVERLSREIKERYGITVEFAEDMVIPDAITAASIDQLMATVSDERVIADEESGKVVLGEQERLLRERVRSVKTLEERRKMEDALLERYYPMVAKDFIGFVLTSQQKEMILSKLSACLAYYPDDLVRTTAHDELKIVFSGNEEKGNATGCNLEYFAETNGLSSGRADRARMDIVLGRDSAGQADFYPSVFHHELFHRMDELIQERRSIYPAYNDLAAQWRQDHHGDEPAYAWQGVDGELKGGFYHDAERDRDPEHPYAQHNGFEDRAQIAMGLMEDYPGIMRQADGDPVLAEKIQAIKDRFWHLSGGVMDDGYWKTLQKQRYNGPTFVAPVLQKYIKKRQREIADEDAARNVLRRINNK